MAHYSIHVQWSDGTPASGRRVSLGFNGIITGGFTASTYTDDRGVAVLHSAGGTATVYVDGSKRGAARPGHCYVTLR